jgi:very-short-patch-repair endonuclease
VGGLRHGAQGMTGIHPTTRANARKLRHEMTPQERNLWAKLRELNRMLGLHFRRQAPIGPFIADFADLGRRVVIEVDGGGHGGERDVARDEWLNAQGFQVLRFWNPEVSGNLEGVMQLVLDAVGPLDDAPPPQPSPTRGEGGSEPSALFDVNGASTPPPPRGEGIGVGGTRPEGKA